MRDTFLTRLCSLACVLLVAGAAFAACSLEEWTVDVEATDNGDGSTTFSVCVSGPDAQRICGLSHFSLQGPPCASGVETFTLRDHPDGALGPPLYCLRFDNLLGGVGGSGGPTSFSCEQPGTGLTLAVDTVAGTARIFGVVYGGEDDGAIWGFGEGLYAVDFLYTGINTVGNGWTADLGSGTGTIEALTGAAAGNTFGIYDYVTGTTPSFLFKEDGHRIGDGSWVGRGWLTTDPAHGSIAGTHDWLFSAIPCNIMDPARTTNPGCWGFGKDPSADECNGGADVWKYDCVTQPDGAEHCFDLTLWGVQIGCGSVVMKGGPGCFSVDDVPVPSCCPDAEPCDPTPPVDPCDPEAQAFSLTQGAYGSAKHYEALACEILTSCPDVATSVEAIASCYGWVDGISDPIGEWVTGNCGVAPQGPDGGFLPSGFGPGENGGAQLIAALINVDGLACHGFDRVGGDPVNAIGRDWIVLSTGQTVGEILDAAVAACGSGFAGILGEINESWDAGFDNGTVSPCPAPGE